jgi:predicted rRNA methylase YqxC with S4 and FtsJ domains
MNMKLYQKLKDLDLVEDFKDFHELIWIRSIKVNGKPVDNPNYEIEETDNIQVGILSLD